MKTKITIIIITMLLMFSIGYILFDKGSEYLQGERQLYYQEGQNNGALAWNEEVTNTLRKEQKLPYISNDTYFSISLKQLCEGN